MTEPSSSTPKVIPRKRATAGLGSRFLIAGAALGGGFSLIGAMVAAAGSTAAAPAETSAIRRIVVVPQAAPDPIYVVLPQDLGVGGTPQVMAVEVPPAPTKTSQLQVPMAQEAAPAPVTESGGS